MIKTGGDIELNPRPKHKQGQCFSICHWNLNSIPAHNSLKLKLLQGYISSSEVDILCLSENFFLIQIFHVVTPTFNYQDLT